MRPTTALLTTLLLVACESDAGLYEPMHQATRQEIPGTFGYELVPVGGFETDIDPVVAWQELPGYKRGAEVSVTLAEVHNAAEGVTWGPSWVFFTNDLCYFTAKGDFVSPSRAGLDDGCTPSNLLVQVVDASTGEFRAVFEAYDADLAWRPHRLGSPDQVPGATSFQ